MLQFLLAVHFVLTLSIIGLIMLQKHDSDGALGSSGGGAASGMFSVRGQANILTKSTAVLMTIFLINCLVMAKLVKHTPQKGSIIDRVAQESAAQIPAKTEKGTENSAKNTIPANKNAVPANKNAVPESKNATPTNKNTSSAGKNTVPINKKSVPLNKDTANNAINPMQNPTNAGKITVPSYPATTVNRATKKIIKKGATPNSAKTKLTKDGAKPPIANKNRDNAGHEDKNRKS